MRVVVSGGSASVWRALHATMMITVGLLPLLSATQATALSNWTPVASLNTPTSMLSAAFGSDGSIYAIGGSDIQSTAYGMSERYSPALNTWTNLPQMPTPRAALAATADSAGQVYAIGGIAGSYPSGGICSAVEAFDPRTGAWTSLPALPRASIYANCTSSPCATPAQATARAGANGNFYLSIPVPDTPAGNYTIGAQDWSYPAAFATASFTVVPNAQLTPTGGPPGSVTMLTGKGFGPYETVSVFATCGISRCTGTPLGSGSANPAGTVSIAMEVPPLGASTYRVERRGSVTGTVAFSEFTVT